MSPRRIDPSPFSFSSKDSPLPSHECRKEGESNNDDKLNDKLNGKLNKVVRSGTLTYPINGNVGEDGLRQDGLGSGSGLGLGGTTRWVEVTDGVRGRESIIVPLRGCRLTHISVEKALDVLHNAGYSTGIALDILRNDLQKSSLIPVPVVVKSTATVTTTNTVTDTITDTATDAGVVTDTDLQGKKSIPAVDLNLTTTSTSSSTSSSSTTSRSASSTTSRSMPVSVSSGSEVSDELGLSWTGEELELFLRAKKR